MDKIYKKVILFCLIFVVGLAVGLFGVNYFQSTVDKAVADNLRLDDQEATIRAINKIIPAVVSIIVYDQETIYILDLMTGKQTQQTSKVEKGSGTGFLISADGLILTNKHIANAGKEGTAEYRIILNSGKQYYAQLIGKDPLNDFAILKIFDKNLPYVNLGDSDKLQLGSTVMAIGNTLGRYQNSVTKGIVSGIGRSLIASDQVGNAEALDNILQTDAGINQGNSGGPLIDLLGNVVGINVAIDQGGSSIGFAIPINDARPVIKSVKEVGRIVRPRLGVRYIMLTPQIAQDNKLSQNSGAWIKKSQDGTPAILPGSPAEKGGILAGDIIIEINAIKIENKNTLISVINKYKPGNRIGLRIVRDGKIIVKIVVLDEFK